MQDSFVSEELSPEIKRENFRTINHVKKSVVIEDTKTAV